MSAAASAVILQTETFARPEGCAHQRLSEDLLQAGRVAAAARGLSRLVVNRIARGVGGDVAPIEAGHERFLIAGGVVQIDHEESDGFLLLRGERDKTLRLPVYKPSYFE
jgi:hypothetical protein